MPNAKLAVTSDFGSFDDRARYGLRTVLPEVPKGRWWLAGKIMPQAFRQTNGLLAESEIDAVLDASGFAFGDQLGAARVQKFASDVKRWKRQGKPVVLLPQAFGPFEIPEIRSAFQDVAKNVDLIFARESKSLEYLSQLGVSSSKLKQAPDFTNLIKCPPTSSREHQVYQSLLVPNHQMIAKANDEQARKYIPFLARCYRHLQGIGLQPAVLLHDDCVDKQLVEPLRQELNEDVPVLTDTNPLELKAILGRAKLVIGSRFHALVGALSQSVPTIAAGWSHKYQMLLADYDCQDATLTVDATPAEIADLVTQINRERHDRHRVLMQAGETLREESQEMWRAVLDAIAFDPQS